MNSTEIAILFLALIAFSAISYRKKALDKQGVLAGNIIGILIFIIGEKSFPTGLIPFFLIVFFFTIAEFCTRYSKHARKSKQEARSTGNILGNSGAAVIALVFAQPIGFFTAVSSALADTASSEIGILSKTKPRLITSFKRVEAGTDGALSTLGTITALLAALLVALIHYALFQNTKAFAIIWLAGFAGMMVDSLLGATLQKKKLLNNSLVNFFACGITAIIAVILYAL